MADRQLETATFAAGCFWGVQAAFDEVSGVVKTTVGYAGGQTAKPSYEQVCAGGTGHTEAVEVVFDTKLVLYENLLKKFWSIHNPTTLNRQGPDVGVQYRSAIFYHSPEQKEAAERSKAEMDQSGKWPDKIVTEIVPAGEFWPAEDYHQKYAEKHGGAACQI